MNINEIIPCNILRPNSSITTNNRYLPINPINVGIEIILSQTTIIEKKLGSTTNTPNNISPYELYTMIRSSSDKTYIFGTNDFLDNHPLVRNFDRQIIN